LIDHLIVQEGTCTEAVHRILWRHWNSKKPSFTTDKSLNTGIFVIHCQCCSVL